MTLVKFQSTQVHSLTAFIVAPDAKVLQSLLRIFLMLQASEVVTRGLGLSQILGPYVHFCWELALET